MRCTEERGPIRADSFVWRVLLIKLASAFDKERDRDLQVVKYFLTPVEASWPCGVDAPQLQVVTKLQAKFPHQGQLFSATQMLIRITD